jgi:hypothetical protein
MKEVQNNNEHILNKKKELEDIKKVSAQISDLSKQMGAQVKAQGELLSQYFD